MKCVYNTMKLDRKQVVTLSVVPALFLAIMIVTRSLSGPYWTAQNSDPDYAYLLNSLNFATNHRLIHVDHPGTPVQIAGGIVMLLHKPLVQNLAEDVLRRPEYYLTVISFVFDIAIALALFLLGQAVARLRLPAAAAPLSQLIALMYAPILAEYLNRVSPEPVLCFLALLLGADMVRACADCDDLSAGKRWAYWGVLAGVGVAAKITFLPVMVALAAVAFPGVRKRLQFCAAALCAFFISTLPIASQYPTFFKWATAVATHTGRYGSGPVGLFPAQSFDSAWKLAADGLLIPALFVLGVGALFSAWKSADPAALVRRRMLLTILGALSLQLIVVSRHPDFRYLLPALPLGGALFAISWRHVTGLPERVGGLRNRAVAVCLLPVVVIAIEVRSFGALLNGFQSRGRELGTIRTITKNHYSDCGLISFYPSSAQEYALNFGDSWSGGVWRPLIQRLYTHGYQYNIWSKDLQGDVILDIGRGKSVQTMASEHPCVLFQGNPSHNMLRVPPPYALKAVYAGKFQTLLLLDGPRLRADIPSDVYGIERKAGLRIEGGSGDWITSDGIDILVPGDMLRSQRKLEATGHTILSEYLGKDVAVRAELRIPGRKPVEVSARMELPYKPKSLVSYKLWIEVNDIKDVPPDRDVAIHLSFNKYVVPQEIGFAPDNRKLVIMIPRQVGMVVPPKPRVQGDGGDWVTSEGFDIVVPGEQLRAQPKIEARGRTILSEYLGRHLTVRAELRVPDRPSKQVSARIELPYKPKSLVPYTIVIEVNPTDVPAGGDVPIHVSFNNYLIPQKIGFAPDPRKLVVMTPYEIVLFK